MKIHLIMGSWHVVYIRIFDNNKFHNTRTVATDSKLSTWREKAEIYFVEINVNLGRTSFPLFFSQLLICTTSNKNY